MNGFLKGFLELLAAIGIIILCIVIAAKLGVPPMAVFVGLLCIATWGFNLGKNSKD